MVATARSDRGWGSCPTVVLAGPVAPVFAGAVTAWTVATVLGEPPPKT